MSYRKGFLLVMWTGCVEINRYGQPVIHRTRNLALRALKRRPSWGRAAVQVKAVRTRPGANGKRDYIIA